MDFKEIIYEKRKGVATITLNTPRDFNSLTDAKGEEMGQALKDAEADPNIYSLILTGTDPGFCSGQNMQRMARHLEGEQVFGDTRTRAFGGGGFGGFSPVAFYHSRLTTIAAVNGPAVGAGMAYTLFFDIRIASEKARFSTMFIRRGLPAHLGETYLLPRIVGPARAFELISLGDFLDASTAEKWGLVSKVVPHEKLMPEAWALAERYAKGPAIAISLGKKLLYRGLDSAPSVEDHMVVEGNYTQMCNNTEDHKEGVKSFFEKREPQFKAR